MHRTLIVLALLGACGKKHHPPRFTGAPSFERVAKARELVHLRDDWDDAVAEIEAEAGPATTTTADAISWALTDGAACAFLTLDRKDHHVASITAQAKIQRSDFVHTDGSTNTFEDCERVATRAAR